MVINVLGSMRVHAVQQRMESERALLKIVMIPQTVARRSAVALPRLCLSVAQTVHNPHCDGSSNMVPTLHVHTPIALTGCAQPHISHQQPPSNQDAARTNYCPTPR